MRIILRKGGLFLFIFFLILILMDRWMDREFYPHYPLQYEEVFSPKVNADLIILGASHATHGINPRYLEVNHLKVYNFSLNGAGPLFNLKWYRKIFRHTYRKPFYVIYGVHWGMFDEGLLQRKLEQDSKYFPLPFLFEEFDDFNTLKTLILNRFAFIRSRKQLAQRLFKKSSDVYILPKYYHGFIPYERRGNLEKKRDVKPKNNNDQIKAFKELLNDFEKEKIGIIFVQVPGYLPARDPLNIEESMHLLNKIAEERKILFLDYDTKKITSINTDPTMFSDWVHLNEKGSDAFSKLLRGDLDFLLKQKTAKE